MNDMSVKKLIEKYEAKIKTWQDKRTELFREEKWEEEVILESNSITLYGVIKDLKELV